MVDTAPRKSLSDILCHQNGLPQTWGSLSGFGVRGKAALAAAEAEWRAAIVAVEHILRVLPRPTGIQVRQKGPSASGVLLSGPLPVLQSFHEDSYLETWLVTPQPLADALNGQHLLLPSSSCLPEPPEFNTIRALPLKPDNAVPEQFCLLITPAFGVGVVLGYPFGEALQMQYSFDPEVLLLLWQQLRSQVSNTAADKVEALNNQVQQAMSVPDYRLVTQFSQVLLAHLPHRMNTTAVSAQSHPVQFASWSGKPSETFAADTPVSRSTAALPAGLAAPDLGIEPEKNRPDNSDPDNSDIASQDVELLQAMAHEIRTPLTTIRTLARSLMRRQDLPKEAQKRLVRIDQECTQQIDRFNLIFRAVELETACDPEQSSLTPVALSQVFQDAIPRWQQQAQRRNLSLEVILPPELPRVTSDPTLLSQVLTGVVEWFTQGLPAQSHIQMQVMLAGHQLKLQFQAESDALSCASKRSNGSFRQPLKSIGQVLTLAPETGGLSLNLNVTKNLFQFLGGKLTVRQRAQQGEVLTVFLPLDTREV